jgi:uncharacterized protein with HEPN domain
MPRKPPKDDAVYLADMLKAAQAVASFAKGKTLADFESDLLLRSAIERQIEIIGEAARHVSKSKRAFLPNIAWTGIIAQRHVLAHEYGEIVAERVWRVASIHVHSLIAQLVPLVPKEAGGQA